ncbi:MAG: YggT family protein [Alphaproteobacteria bacterium]|jgi:YggT family protein
MTALIFLIQAISKLIFWIVIGHVILSWLISFNIVNMNNQFVYQLYTNLDRLLEPMLKPIRSILPSMGGLDLSPILLLIGVQFMEILLLGTVVPALFGY